MNVHFPVRRSRWPGRLVQLAVIVVVAAVAAATFMLSYAGVHAVALQAGVPRDLARYYPGILDAVLVIACAAAPVLRDARWWARCYAWLAILVVVVVIGGIDAVHAMSVALPHRATAGVAAVLPWALLLLAFSLWLTILRHSRAQHAVREPEMPEMADVAEAPVARKALEAAAPPVALAADGEGEGEGEGVTAGEPVVAEADAADEAGDGQALEPEQEAEADTEAVPQADADAEPGNPDKEALDEATATEPTGESGDVPEMVTDIPAVTYATGPRLRRVRSLPAPPVGDE
jgi:hypothetical protein